MVNRKELEGIVSRLREKGIVVNAHLAYLIADKVDEIKTNRPFGEAIRLALNECQIRERAVRRTYARVLGAYFGAHGGKKAAQNRRRNITITTPPKKPRQIGVIVEDSGQYALEI